MQKDFEVIHSDDEWPFDVSEMIIKKHTLELCLNHFDNDLIEL